MCKCKCKSASARVQVQVQAQVQASSSTSASFFSSAKQGARRGKGLHEASYYSQLSSSSDRLVSLRVIFALPPGKGVAALRLEVSWDLEAAAAIAGVATDFF